MPQVSLEARQVACNYLNEAVDPAFWPRQRRLRSPSKTVPGGLRTPREARRVVEGIQKKLAFVKTLAILAREAEEVQETRVAMDVKWGFVVTAGRGWGKSPRQ